MVSRRNMLKTGLTAVFGACAVQTASASEVQQKSQKTILMSLFSVPVPVA